MGPDPELDLLLGLLRSAIGSGPGTAPPPRSRIDWDAFGARVARHCAGPLLHARLPAESRAEIPEATLRGWAEASLANTRRALAQAAALAALAQRLDGAGIPFISVKGPLLAQQLYGGPGLRRAGDLDLLVAPADADRADAFMRSEGFARTRPDFELSPRQARAYAAVQYEYEYVGGRDRMRVELMWRLEGLPPDETIWDGAPRAEVAGRSIRVLPPDANACYLMLHGARHGWYRLFWLVDAALLLRGGRTDWDAAMARARAARTERALQQGASLAGSLLGAPVPDALVPGARERRPVARLAAEARRQIALDPSAARGAREWLRQLAYRVRLQRGWRGRLAVLKPHLVSLSSWKAVRLPDSLFPLYHVLTPFLWAGRRLAGSARGRSGRPSRSPGR
jgi:hypothetical protein